MSTPSATDLRHAAATKHVQSGAYGAAIQLFEALLDEIPDEPDILNDTALAYAQHGDTQQAEAYLLRALEAQPEHETAFYNLLELLTAKGKHLAACDVFTTYADSLPNSEKKNQFADHLCSQKPPNQQSEGLIVRVNKDQLLKRHLFIITQPRSGSTVFWKTMRSDSRLRCYNEPFNRHLRHLFESGQDYKNSKSRTHNKVFTEFLAIPNLLRKHWSSIQPTEELYPELIGHQIKYIRALLNTAKHVCIDFITCNAKVDHIRDAFPDALIVHLVRDPRSWTTSHLRPYGEWIRGLPSNFFCHDGWFNFWSRQDLARHLDISGYAHEQLLQIWHRLTLAAEKSRPDITVQFEYFARNPERVLRAIYQFIEIPYTSIDTTSIHYPNAPYANSDSRWREAIHAYLDPRTRNFIHSF
jgi:tetratricopeptide (TPR) repeat protein